MPDSAAFAVSVTHQAAGRRKLAQEIHHRNRVPRRQRDEVFTMEDEHCIVGDQERTCPLLDKRCKDGIEVAFMACIEDKNFLPERASGHLHVCQLSLSLRTAWVHETGDKAHLWNQLAQHFQALCGQRSRQNIHACDVAAGSVEARN